jgi:hypothetical protein
MGQSMNASRIHPEKITKPIQLTAVWFLALIVIVGLLLKAAWTISSPTWLVPVLAISAIVIVLLFLGVAFLMLTKYRTHLQDDTHYSKWLDNQQKLFNNFSPENTETKDSINLANIAAISETWQQRENRRIEKYKSVEGLFLVHSWRPSMNPEQVADIVIWVHQHGNGPLTQGLVEKVEYHLGPRFFTRPMVKQNAHENFKLEVSAYGPMLCLARVFIRGRQLPIDLERYIDFEEIP